MAQNKVIAIAGYYCGHKKGSDLQYYLYSVGSDKFELKAQSEVIVFNKKGVEITAMNIDDLPTELYFKALRLIDLAWAESIDEQ